ncbi:MAG: ribonuclease III [Actinomycetota bacterium]
MSLLTSPREALAHLIGLDPASDLFVTALTHSSYAAEHGVESNERLEFLGDAVVDLVITDTIIRSFPNLNQGTGSLTRSKVVNEAALAEVASALEIGRVVRLGRGEIKNHGEQRPALLADAFEAVVAAIYLERGYGAASEFVLTYLGGALTAAAAAPDEVDPKSRLRQWSEAAGHGAPVYEVRGDGPSHATHYVAEVTIGGIIRATGQGRSKKAAEVAAAIAAWGEKHV